jgi:hypothetical protein
MPDSIPTVNTGDSIHDPDMDANHFASLGVDLAKHGMFFGRKPIPKPGRKPSADIPNVFAKGGGHDVQTPDYDVNITDARIVKDVRTENQGANDFDSGTVVVFRAADSTEVSQILPMDTLRTRALILNTGTSAVIIGKMGGGLQQGNGFTLPANSAFSLEILTQGRVWACVVPTAPANTTCALSIWIERNR